MNGGDAPDRMKGSPLIDILSGGSGADQMCGNGGEDDINAGEGADSVFGGGGGVGEVLDCGTQVDVWGGSTGTVMECDGPASLTSCPW
jgi:Ca2+-binding RTX toxin-like protein